MTKSLNTLFKSIAIVLLIFISTLSMAQQEFDIAIAQKHINYLASDELEGRMTGTAGETKAANYISNELKQIGLTNKNNESFIEEFSFIADRVIAEEVALKINKKDYLKSGKIIALRQSGSGKYNGKFYDAGHGLVAKDLDVNHFNNVPPNAAYLIRLSTPNGHDPHSNLHKHATVAQKIVNALKQGAKAIVFINEDSTYRVPEFRFKPQSKSLDIPIIYYDGAIQLKKTKNKLQLKISVENRKAVGKNVVAILDNSSPYNVIIGAHYDHLGFGKNGSLSTEKNAVHNGADDNASGVSLMLEVANMLASNNIKEKYNYIFVAFSGEELGLFGSSSYINNQTAAFQNSVNYMINFDMVGRLNNDNELAINGIGTSPYWEENLNAINDGSLKLTLSASGTGPSDHTSFYLKNIPVLHFFSGNHKDYHKPSDDADKINYKGMAAIYNYVVKLILDLEKEPKLKFTKTKEVAKMASSFSVTLGIMPSYIYSGKGLKVDGVSEGKPGKIGGLLAGDIIVKMGDLDIIDIYSYMEGLSKYKRGETTQIVILRKGASHTLQITF